MKVKELVELLNDLEPDAEVWLAHQEHYPLQFTIAGVYDPAYSPVECELHGIAYEETTCAECDEITDDRHSDGSGVVYIVEGGHPEDPETWKKKPYAPREAWDAARRY